MKPLNLLGRLKAAVRPIKHPPTYAQCGEDRILHFLFGLLEISKPTYLDIGAHDAVHLSNTYLFYAEGSRGVCVEPNPILHQRIQARRPRDTCLNIGISAGKVGTLAFYIFDDPTLSTFSEEIKDEQVQTGKVLMQTLQVQVESVNEIMLRYFQGAPNFVSLDTEGLDLAILETVDFQRFRPEAFCIETITNVEERKMSEIIDFMRARNYLVYADTYVNTVFVERESWERALQARRSSKASPATAAA